MTVNATNRVYGLGLTLEEFWFSTPRELAAHQRLFDAGREFLQSLHAGIQATLHNAHFQHKKGKPFTAEMFMPGYQQLNDAADESWKSVQRQVRYMRKATEHEKAAMDNNAGAFQSRMLAAKRARERGASREEILKVMEA